MIRYYTIWCPECIKIKALLDKKNIQYECISDFDTVMNVADDNNIMQAPFAEVDGIIMKAEQLKNYIDTL